MVTLSLEGFLMTVGSVALLLFWVGFFFGIGVKEIKGDYL